MGGYAVGPMVNGFFEGMKEFDENEKRDFERKKAQEKWALDQQLLKNTLDASNRVNQAQNQWMQAAQTGNYPWAQNVNPQQQEIDVLKQKTMEQDKAIKKQQGSKFKSLLNDFAASLDPEGSLLSIRTALKEDEETTRKIGIDPDSLRMYNPNSKDDRIKLTNYLSTQIPGFDMWAKPLQDATIDSIANAGIVVENKGKPFDLMGAGKISGAFATMKPGERAIWDKKVQNVIEKMNGVGGGEAPQNLAWRQKLDELNQKLEKGEITQDEYQKQIEETTKVAEGADQAIQEMFKIPKAETQEGQTTAQPESPAVKEVRGTNQAVDVAQQSAAQPQEEAKITGVNYKKDYIPRINGKPYVPRKSTNQVVLHWTAGNSYEGARSAYKNTGNIPHFTVAKDGTIYQNLPIEAVGSHDRDNNASTIGIEVVNPGYEKEGQGGQYDNITPEQQKALAKLSGRLAQQFNLSPEQFVAHSDTSPEKNRFEAQGIKQYVRESLAGDNTLMGGGSTPVETAKATNPRQPTKPQEAIRQSLTQPYHQLSPETRMAMLGQVAGYGDSRTALMKNLDQINDRFFGGQGNMDDVAQTYVNLKQAGTHQQRPFAYQQLIQDYSDRIGQKVAAGQMTPEEGKAAIGEFTDAVFTGQALGKGAADIQDRAKMQGTNIASWEGTLASNFKIGMDNETIKEDLKREYPLREKNKTLYNNSVKTVDSYVVSQNTAKDLAQEMDKLEKAKKLNRGVLDQMGQIIASYMTTGSLPEGAIESLNKTAGMDTKLGVFMADYLRMMSGLASTDKEFARTASRIALDFGKQPRETIAKLNAFAEAAQKRAYQGINQLGNLGFTGTAKQYYKALQGVGLGYNSSTTKKVTGESPITNSAADQTLPEITTTEQLKALPIGSKYKYKGKIYTKTRS